MERRGARRGATVDEVRRLLDAETGLVDRGAATGAATLHLAVQSGSYDTVALLLDRGANVHAFKGSARGLAGGQWRDLQAIDLAIWCRDRRAGDAQIARLLLSR